MSFLRLYAIHKLQHWFQSAFAVCTHTHTHTFTFILHQPSRVPMIYTFILSTAKGKYKRIKWIKVLDSHVFPPALCMCRGYPYHKSYCEHCSSFKRESHKQKTTIAEKEKEMAAKQNKTNHNNIKKKINRNKESRQNSNDDAIHPLLNDACLCAWFFCVRFEIQFRRFRRFSSESARIFGWVCLCMCVYVSK